MIALDDVVASLGRGVRPAADGLLGTCRLEWRGGEAYGEEAILESFRMNPLDVAAGQVIADERNFVAIGDGGALFGDLYDGRVGRLWRVGSGEAPGSEPAIAVAFDPDLAQARGDVLFRAADHPGLPADLAPPLLAAARELVEAELSAGLHRARLFVVRALAVQGTVAALGGLYRLGGGAVRTSGFAHAILVVEPGSGTRIAVDPPPTLP